VKELPWGVLILMGGGFALAAGFKSSGLTSYVGDQLADAADLSGMQLSYLIVLCVCFMTEITSNTATANVILPILASVSVSTLTHPLRMMLPATMGCSMAFMLPAATPPNSIIFAVKRTDMSDFIKAGLTLNLLAVGIVTPIIYGMAVHVFEVDGAFPQWACLEGECEWLTSEACRISDENNGLCQFANGALWNLTSSSII